MTLKDLKGKEKRSISEVYDTNEVNFIMSSAEFVWFYNNLIPSNKNQISKDHEN